MPNKSLASTLTTALLLSTTTHLATAMDRGSYTTCPQVPSLQCRNGSNCVEGIAKFDPKHDPLDLQTHEEGWHCDCLPGFIGHECEIEVSDCQTNSYDPTESVLHSCYHGSTCKSSGDAFYCDCDKLNASSSPTASKFAGLMCEHEATSLCAVTLVQTAAPNKQFCTNHGKCIKMVTEGEPHPGCLCRTGWMGDHCEIRVDPFAKVDPLQSPMQGGGNQAAGKALFSILIIAMGLVLGGIAYIIHKTRKESKGPRAKAMGKTAAEARVGDLEADGSGTLGTANDAEESGEADNSGDGAEGGLELTETKPDPDEAVKADVTQKEII